MTKQLFLAAAMLSFSAPAFAQISEIRLGANFHDIDWSGAGNDSSKERSSAINCEIMFEEPELLKWALSPQPYLGGALNFGGETSFGGGGLLWRQTIGENFYFDFSFGLVVHDGTLEATPSSLVQSVIDDADIENSFTDEQRAQFLSELEDFRFHQDNGIDFGNRLLFREQISIGYRWSENWSAHLFVEHLSHGNILAGARPNEGLDTLGMRASYHFSL